MSEEVFLNALTVQIDGAWTAVTQDAPTELSAAAKGNSKIRVTWTGPASGTAVLLYRNTIDNLGSASLIGVVLDGIEEYLDTGLAAATKYYYWAKATSGTALSSAAGSVNATTLSNYSVDTRRSEQDKNDIEIDLVQYFVANLLRVDGTANFSNGYDRRTATDGIIPLLPGRLTEQPGTQGAVIVEEQPANGNFRHYVANVSVTFRGQENRDGNDDDVSGQELAYGAATALEEYLHREEGDLTNETLPSGRVALAFNKITKTSIGEDDLKRYLVTVSFEVRIVGDDSL
jgi:hypothetical protein